jgi:hypothetical protein
LDAVAAALLGLVEGLVGAGEELLEGGIAGLEAGDAETGREGDVLADLRGGLRQSVSIP